MACLDALGLRFLDILSLVLVGAASMNSSSPLLETVAINLADLDATGFFFLEISRRVLPPVSTLLMLSGGSQFSTLEPSELESSAAKVGKLDRVSVNMNVNFTNVIYIFLILGKKSYSSFPLIYFVMPTPMQKNPHHL